MNHHDYSRFYQEQAEEQRAMADNCVGGGERQRALTSAAAFEALAGMSDRMIRYAAKAERVGRVKATAR